MLNFNTLHLELKRRSIFFYSSIALFFDTYMTLLPLGTTTKYFIRHLSTSLIAERLSSLSPVTGTNTFMKLQPLIKIHPFPPLPTGGYKEICFSTAPRNLCVHTR